MNGQPITKPTWQAFHFLNRLLLECEYELSYEQTHATPPQNALCWKWAQWIKSTPHQGPDPRRIEIMLDDRHISVSAFIHSGIHHPPKAATAYLSFDYPLQSVFQWCPEEIRAMENFFHQWVDLALGLAPAESG